MISLRGVRFTYPGDAAPVLDGLDLDIAEGEFVLVAGPSGAGKSTLLRTFNGLVPHYTGGTFSGSIRIFGREAAGLPPRELADLVGFVPQDPWAHATADRVLPELTFSLENLRVPAARMRKRVEEVLDSLGIASLRTRRLDTLSGGERQRVAIAAVLAAQPKVLVLDEPTSNLDPGSAEDVFSVLVRLRDELGLTIVCSEHRLDRVAAFCDRVCYLRGGFGGGAADPLLGRFPSRQRRTPRADGPAIGEPRDVFASMPFAPPVAALGRALGWSPLPLTVREGRKFARDLCLRPPSRAYAVRREPVLRAERVRASHNGTDVLRGVSFDLAPGELCAVVGRNGAGKTTLLRSLVGLAHLRGGAVSLGGEKVTDTRRIARRVSFVPQRAETILFRDSVEAEIQSHDWLRRAGIEHLADRHPWELSAGQRLWTALATAFSREPEIMLLDEPTRGLDPPGKERLAGLLQEACERGAAVLLVTHDVELVARAATRVALLAEGEVVADGPTHEVLGESLLFSSQTSKVMDDPRFLTPADVLGAARG